VARGSWAYRVAPPEKRSEPGERWAGASRSCTRESLVRENVLRRLAPASTARTPAQRLGRRPNDSDTGATPSTCLVPRVVRPSNPRSGGDRFAGAVCGAPGRPAQAVSSLCSGRDVVPGPLPSGLVTFVFTDWKRLRSRSSSARPATCRSRSSSPHGCRGWARTGPLRFTCRQRSMPRWHTSASRCTRAIGRCATNCSRQPRCISPTATLPERSSAAGRPPSSMPWTRHVTCCSH
jgi:hypothetical protein